MQDGEPCVILENTRWSSRVKVRRVLTACVFASCCQVRSFEKTFKSGDSVEGAGRPWTWNLRTYIATVSFWHFMNNESLSSLRSDEAAVGENVKWLVETRSSCTLTLWGMGASQLTGAATQNFVELEIVETATQA